MSALFPWFLSRYSDSLAFSLSSWFSRILDDCTGASHFRCMWCSRQTFLSFFHSTAMLSATEGSEVANLEAIERLPCVSQTDFPHFLFQEVLFGWFLEGSSLVLGLLTSHSFSHIWNEWNQESYAMLVSVFVPQVYKRLLLQMQLIVHFNRLLQLRKKIGTRVDSLFIFRFKTTFRFPEIETSGKYQDWWKSNTDYIPGISSVYSRDRDKRQMLAFIIEPSSLFNRKQPRLSGLNKSNLRGLTWVWKE